MGREDEEEDVSSYWMTLNKKNRRYWNLKHQEQYRILWITVFGRVYRLVAVELTKSLAPVGNRPPIPRSSSPSLVAAAPELSYSGSTSCTATFDLCGYTGCTALALPCPMTAVAAMPTLLSGHPANWFLQKQILIATHTRQEGKNGSSVTGYGGAI